MQKYAMRVMLTSILEYFHVLSDLADIGMQVASSAL